MELLLIHILMNIIFMLLGISELLKMINKDKPNWRIWFVLAAVIIVAFTTSMIYIREISFNLTLFIFLTVWITDTSAYFCGIVIGGKKFAIDIL